MSNPIEEIVSGIVAAADKARYHVANMLREALTDQPKPNELNKEA